MTQSMIIAERVFNQKSNNMVWVVSISGVEQENAQRSFIFDPHKALRYAFLLKARTGKNISREAVEMLKLHCTLIKATEKADEPKAGESEAVTAEPEVAEPVKEEKKPRTRRVKKEKTEVAA